MHEDTTFQVEIQIKPDLVGQIDEAGLQTAVATALHHQAAPAGATVTLVITGDEEIRQLNRQFRQVDAPTDVLAFPTASEAPFVEAPGQPLYLGDVVISHPRAVAQATVAGHPLPAELALLAVHGTLHLLGHDHATPQQKTAMWAAQQAILANWELKIENSPLAVLHKKMHTCRRCLEAGYPITPGAVFSGPASARIMIVGQAPGITEVMARRPFNASSGRRLFQWLAAAGWDEVEFRATQYMTAITKCYPGKQPGASSKGDRVPTAAERKLCAPFLERELEIVRPELIIPVGGLAIKHLIGQGKLVDIIGQVYKRPGHHIVPLPHPSGVSLWLNRPENLTLVQQAIDHLRQFKRRP